MRGKGDNCSTSQDRLGGRWGDLELITLDLLTFDSRRRVPADSCTPVEGGSDCGSNSFCNARLTVVGVDSDHASKAHDAEEEDVVMHFADYDDALG